MYKVGDHVQLNCLSERTEEKPKLTWYINDIQVNNKLLHRIRIVKILFPYLILFMLHYLREQGTQRDASKV